MKKVLLMVVVLFACMAASAQVYVGGSLGFASVKPIGGGDSETTYKIVPEVGYNISETFAIGVALGYRKGNCSLGNAGYAQDVTTEVFGITPYARYSPVEWEPVKLFFDGGIGFESLKDMGSNFSVGIRPGVAVTLSDQISFVAHLGFFGFETFSPSGKLKDSGVTKSGSAFGIDLDNSIDFGVYFNF